MSQHSPTFGRPITADLAPARAPESRPVRRRRLFLGCAAEIESLYGITGKWGGQLVGYHEGFPRRARRRAARAKAKRLFLEARA